jgi:Spy/CpxP family protein refolding chaperone
MKKLVVAFLLIVGITAMAQEKEMKRPNGDKFASLTPEQKVEYQVKKMSKDLSLNDKQVKEVKALVTKEVEKRNAIIAEMKALQAKQRIEMKAKIDEEYAAMSNEMRKILTSEQFTKWEKIHEERREKMKEKMKEKRENKKINAIPDEK